MPSFLIARPSRACLMTVAPLSRRAVIASCLLVPAIANAASGGRSIVKRVVSGRPGTITLPSTVTARVVFADDVLPLSR